LLAVQRQSEASRSRCEIEAAQGIAGPELVPLKTPPGSSLHDLTWTLIDPSGRVLRKELNKQVVSTTGKWVLIAYLFEELDTDTGEDREPRIALVRYQRRGLLYHKQRHFTVSAVQCAHLIDLFAEWLGVTEKIGRLVEKEPQAYPELPVPSLPPPSASPVSRPMSPPADRSAAPASASTPASPAAPSVETSASDAAASPESD
jgi:hypothetical protein